MTTPLLQHPLSHQLRLACCLHATFGSVAGLTKFKRSIFQYDCKSQYIVLITNMTPTADRNHALLHDTQHRAYILQAGLFVPIPS